MNGCRRFVYACGRYFAQTEADQRCSFGRKARVFCRKSFRGCRTTGGWFKWGTSNAGLNKSIESLNDLLSDTASRWGDLYACTARGINNGTDLISWMKTIAWNQNPWQILMRNNKQEENRKPAEHDMVVSPLSTGPILIRLAQRKSSLNLQVAMAVVDDLSTWDVRKGLKREVYLSQKTSWPKGKLKPAESGFTWVLDDSRTLGDTVSGLVKKLKQLPGLESRLIY